MDCKYAQDLAAFLDGELTEAEAGNLAAHLETCPDCRERLSLLKRSYGALDLLGEVAVPSGFAERVRSRVRKRSYVPVLVAAAALILAAMVMLHLGEREVTVPGPDEGQEAVVLAGLSDEERAVVENLDLFEDYEILEDLDLFAQFDTLEELEEFPEIEAI
ncbi:MAG: anti-sigma factor family protein [Planctomycetota bacterium]